MKSLAADRLLLATLGALLVFRLWFAATLPLTGDEAYFVVWGQRPAGGYYDHPPMIGWWLAALLPLGMAEWWLRLPAVLMPFALAWIAWLLLRHRDRVRARYAALLTLLLPTDVWNVLVTTDTPVVLFSMLSVLAYVRGMRNASFGWHALAGLLLGAAFLGKYFAALLGFAFAAHILFVRRDRLRFAMLAVLTACALLGPAWNLWWNAGHCWSNILFNFFNRNERSGFDWENPLLYLVSVAYLATPWQLWALWRGRAAVSAAIAADAATRAVLWLAAVPLAIFFLMSFVKAVGLHWLLAFMPLLAVIAAASLPEAALQRLFRWSVGFALLHVLAAALLVSLPLSTWKGSNLHAGAVFTWRGGELAQQLQEPLARCGEGCVVAMESYSSAATLSYALRRPVVVFGDGSFHGRQDDLDTDFRSLDGRDFLIVRKETVREESYSPYFSRIDIASFAIDGVPMHVVRGQGFRYAVYHERMLTRVRDRYYRFDRLPSWLPQLGCPLTDRYFPGESGR